ncbi:gamma-glutamyl-gamma-aminobutyrate hydrolase family protein [Gammaproteobacteria bacterium AB-CW1]|uniref:Gamma-glutamyl-gamma-aminobutyrate hydrolase family protein n=1 Tax=Natronospira elongata TaxID=3110268 RepID=A0AAP6JGQ4_9GAMM|nr:gamma-glutamyl-gamma-aminobutyrate hydrolase family protein [Gammaproteobacteria bacterium AB-CW1]
MKRIGVTQRVEVVASYGERRDCLDQQWGGLLKQLGFLLVPVPNGLSEPGAWLEVMGLDGFILSGGNDLAHLPDASRPAPERDATETAILDYAKHRQMPVLGVCRGLQMMNVYLGGSLVPVEGHVATRHSVTPVAGESLFSAYSEVNSFHDWGIAPEGLAETLSPGVRCQDGTIEAARHTSLPWASVMWHPERESPFLKADLELLQTIF